MANPLVFNDFRRTPLKIDAFLRRVVQPNVANASPSTVTLHFSAEAAKRLRHLATNYGDGSRSDVIRRALHLYDWCRTAEITGASLMLKSADGRMQDVRLP
jgi:Ribbon-helix-helix protein, copG family